MGKGFFKRFKLTSKSRKHTRVTYFDVVRNPQPSSPTTGLSRYGETIDEHMAHIVRKKTTPRMEIEEIIKEEIIAGRRPKSSLEIIEDEICGSPSDMVYDEIKGFDDFMMY